MAAVALLFTTSCLDDSMVDIEKENFAGSPYIADFNEMPNAAGYIKRTFNGTTDPTISYPAEFRVNLSSPWQLDEDLTLKIQLDEQAVLDYIANEDPDFQLLSSTKHTFTEATVTIPAGEREATFEADFFPEGLSADDLYMVAFSIVETSNPDVKISGNFGTQYCKIGVTNIFHGTYKADPIQWIYQGHTDYSFLCPDEVDFGTLSSVTSQFSYTYPGWGNTYEVTVDLENKKTIEGHENAYSVTWIITGREEDSEMVNDHEGEVWNYCWQSTDGKWHFKIAGILQGSGPHFSKAIYHQQ